MFRMNLFMDIVRRNERMINNINHLYDPDYNHNDNGQLFDANQDYSRPTLQRPIMGIYYNLFKRIPRPYESFLSYKY